MVQLYLNYLYLEKNNFFLIMNLKIIKLILLVFFITFSSTAEEFKVSDNNTKFNVYTGMFDFSDDG